MSTVWKNDKQFELFYKATGFEVLKSFASLMITTRWTFLNFAPQEQYMFHI